MYIDNWSFVSMSLTWCRTIIYCDY